MAKNHWLPGDSNAPTMGHEVDGVPVYPVKRVVNGKTRLMFTYSADGIEGEAFFSKRQTKLVPVKFKDRMKPVKRGTPSSGNNSKPHGVKYWAPNEWAGGKIPSVRNKR